MNKKIGSLPLILSFCLLFPLTAQADTSADYVKRKGIFCLQ